MFIIGLAEVIPDARVGRNDVRLIATIGDHVMRTLRQPQMLPAKVPTDVHQLNRIKRALTTPRSASRVRALPLEVVFDTDDCILIAAAAPRHAEAGRDVREQHNVHILEQAGANVICLGADQLFGYARPQSNSALQMLAFHHFFDCQRCGNVQWHTGVVAFAMSRRAFNQRVVIAHTGLLRRLRNAVDIGAERDHRLARSPTRHPSRRYAGDATLNLEPFFFQDARQVSRGLKFLKAELAEAEDGVHHYLDLLLHTVDLADQIGLHRRLFRCRLSQHLGRRRDDDYHRG